MKGLAIALALLISAAAAAQAPVSVRSAAGPASPFAPAETRFSLDVHAGAGVSRMNYISGKTRVWMSPVDSYAAGAGVRYYLLSGVAAESGFNLVTRGGYDKDLFNNKYSSTYIEVPLTLSLSVLILPSFRLSLEGGGYVAYGISGSTVNEAGRFPYFSSGSYAVAKPLDYGAGGGLSAEIARRVRLSVRYEYGFCNIAGGNIKKITGLHNESVIFLAGYLF